MARRRASAGEAATGSCRACAARASHTCSDRHAWPSSQRSHMYLPPAAERPVFPGRFLEHDHHFFAVQQQRSRLELGDDFLDDLALDLHAASDRQQDFNQYEVPVARRNQVRIIRVETKILVVKLEHTVETV